MLKVERVPIDSLNLDPNNARKHSDRNLDAIKGSLNKFGQLKNIVVWKDTILAGNGTYAAARRLGWDSIDIVRVDHMSFTEATAYSLSDNKTAELAEWDDDILKGQLDALLNEGFEIEDIGFDIDDIPGLGGNPGLTDEDEIPEQKEENARGVNLGDIWQLGSHRIMCGDSTVKENVEKLMDGATADMVYTDPPYGIDVNTDWSNSRGNGYKQKVAKSHGCDVSKWNFTENYKHNKIINDDVLLNINFIFDLSTTFYVWGGDYFLRFIPDNIYKNCSLLIWDKNGGHENLDATIGSSFESCLVSPKRKRNIIYRTWRGMMGRGDGSGFLKDKITLEGDCSLHPTQKPVRLHLQVFEVHKLDSMKVVVDPFLGSGSTLIACEKTNKTCYGMELDPHYVSVIIDRWEKFTGQKAKNLEA